MIRNIKIHIILDIIEISKFVEPNKRTQIIFYENVHLNVFLMIFQSLMGLGKSRCDVPNGTTQGHDYLRFSFWIWTFVICGELCFQVGRSYNNFYVKTPRFISFEHC
jgi:hypothetical protein